MGTIGLLPGTFDPPHNGHLNLISEALWSKEVDTVLLVPVENSESIAPLETRIFMCDLLTTLYPPGKLKVSRSGLRKNIDLLYSEIGDNPIKVIRTNEPKQYPSFF